MRTPFVRPHVLAGALFASAFLILSGCDCGAIALQNDGGSVGGGAGGGDTGTGGSGGGGQVGQGGGAVSDGGGAGGGGGTGGGDGTYDGGYLPDGGCPVYDCTGKCGPVRDFCSGSTVECGACTSGVCNLLTNTCGPALITCGSLGAECGVTKNSCGRRISCPDDGGTSACGDGLECDRNTNKCVPCSNPSPGDLGYQCGSVWLGCGPYTNLTDAGTCGNGYQCNGAFNICEPLCTPGVPATICSAKGAECGLVTDGCGSTVNCGGCATGTSCGARGVPNQCDPPEYPDECLVANRNCGPYVSACGGPTLNCGTCTVPGEVCNPNGRCGPPCTPTTCTGDLNGHCGAQLDAGCGVAIDCGCTNTSLVCTSSDAGVVGDCKTPAACGQFTTGTEDAGCSNGASPTFSGLTCPCSGSATCLAGGSPVTGTQSGTCCVNHATCPLNACATSVADSCTGAPIPCTCTVPSTFCNAPSDGGAGTCAQYHTCTDYGATGGADAGCSNGNDPSDFPRFPGDPVGLTCRCTAVNGNNCYRDAGVVAGTTGGNCCQNTQVCSIVNGGGVGSECNTTKNNTCTDAGITCGCTQSGTHCNNVSHLCEADNGCSRYTNGQAGSTCSAGPDPDFPKGDGSNLTCTCSAAGANCYSDAGVILTSGSTTGHCCVPVACPANACGTSVFDPCTGQTIQCNACTPAGNGTVHCDSASHTCVPNLTCASYNANGNGASPPQQGDVCSNGPAFSNGATPPTNLTCLCNNNDVTEVCVNGTTRVTGSTTGNCCINNVTCQGTATGGTGTTGWSCNTSLTNSCTGSAIACGACATNYYCDNTNHCQPNLTCSNDGSGWTGANGSICSTSNNTAFPRYISPPAPAADTTGQTCNCTGGRECSVASGAPNPHLAGATELGNCCTNTNTCNGAVGSKCNQQVTDNCTSVVSNCPTCTSSAYCSLPDAGLATGAGNPGTCKTDPYSCSTYTTRTPGTPAGTRGATCSNSASTAFPRYPGDGTGLSCTCTSGGCYDASGNVVSGSTTGQCCTPVACAPGQCGGSVFDPCTNKTIPCTAACGSGQYCKSNFCANYETCSTYTTQALGATCTNGADPNWPKGDGTNLTCSCTTSGAVCVKPVPGSVVSGSTEGTCCKNTATATANSCGSYVDTCTGQTVPYTNCNAGSHCPAGNNGTCITDKTCSTYGANGAVTNPCSNGADSAFHDGAGGANLTCQCSTAGGYSNIQCSGWNATTAGTCTCTPTAPANCSDNGKADGCGGSMVSNCSPGTQVCFSNACCTLPVCKAGAIGDPCGTISQCGTNTNCGACDTSGGKTKNTCTSNVCACTKYTVGDCAPNNWHGPTSDGCGGTYICPS